MEPNAEKLLGIETLLGEMNTTDNNEFMKQLGGSGAANLLTVGLFFIIWIVKNKFKHSECEGNSICCRCKVNDDDESSEGRPQGRRVREEAKEEMQSGKLTVNSN